MASASTGRADLYQQVTDRITAALQAGTIPWRQPWTAARGRPASMSTGRAYRGVNILLLGLAAADRGYASPWWGTYRQIAGLGGQVRRGETSVQVVFWKQLQARDPEAHDQDADAGQRRTVPLLRAFRVFNAEQASHLPARYRAPVTAGPELAGQARDVLAGYLAAGGPGLVHAAGAGPSYSPARDQITLPAPAQFAAPEAYWSTAFHEAAHSTGHPSRLNRPGVAAFDHYGSGRYAREELIAEIAGAMLAAATGAATQASLRDDTAAYVVGWLGALGNDRKLVVTAASQAQHAADRVLEPQRQAQPRPEAASRRPASPSPPRSGPPGRTWPPSRKQAASHGPGARNHLPEPPEPPVQARQALPRLGRTSTPGSPSTPGARLLQVARQTGPAGSSPAPGPRAVPRTPAQEPGPPARMCPACKTPKEIRMTATAATPPGQPQQPEDSSVLRARLPGDLTAARQARSAVRAALAAWGMTDPAGDAELLASELVANAAEHARGPIGLALHRQAAGGGLRCEVTDTSPGQPRPRDAGTDAERGRGLAIVTALATASGVRAEPPGKTTWFTLALQERAARIAQHPGPEPEPEAEAEAGA